MKLMKGKGFPNEGEETVFMTIRPDKENQQETEPKITDREKMREKRGTRAAPESKKKRLLIKNEGRRGERTCQDGVIGKINVALGQRKRVSKNGDILKRGAHL